MRGILQNRRCYKTRVPGLHARLLYEHGDFLASTAGILETVISKYCRLRWYIVLDKEDKLTYKQPAAASWLNGLNLNLSGRKKGR